MNIKTLNLSGVEVKVSDVNGNYLAIKNNGTETLYASKMPNIIPGEDNVLSIKANDSAVLPIWNNTAYLSGSGEIVIMGSSRCEDFFKPIVDIETDVRAIRENLLINPDFKINQRKLSGTISSPGEIVDCWTLTEGTVIITESGLILDGTITQKVVLDAGHYSVSSNAGNAVFDNNTGIFSLSASNELIIYAKLEKGINASRFCAPDHYEELAKCQHRMIVISQYIRYGNTLISNDVIDFNITLPVCMKDIPSFDTDNFCVKSSVDKTEEGFTFSLLTMSGNTITIRATKASHGLTKAYLELTAPLQFTAP